MNDKNYNNTKMLKCFGIFMSFLMLFLMKYLSASSQMVLGVIISIFCLILCIFFIYGRQFSGVIMMIILLIMVIFGVCDTYFESKEVYNNCLILIYPILFILMCIFGYKSTVENGNEEKIESMKKKVKRAIIFLVVVEIYFIIIFVPKLFS